MAAERRTRASPRPVIPSRSWSSKRAAPAPNHPISEGAVPRAACVGGALPATSFGPVAPADGRTGGIALMSAPLLDPAERHFSRSHQSGTARGKLQSSLSCASVCIRCIWCRKCGNWQAYSTLLNWSTPARARARDRRRQLLKDRLQQWEDFYNYDRPRGALAGEALMSSSSRRHSTSIET